MSSRRARQWRPSAARAWMVGPSSSTRPARKAKRRLPSAKDAAAEAGVAAIAAGVDKVEAGAAAVVEASDLIVAAADTPAAVPTAAREPSETGPVDARATPAA